MEYHEILSNPLGAQQEPTPRLDSAPATIFENNPSFLQETPSKQSSPQQESPTKRTRSKRSILGFPKREKNKTLDAVPPVKKSFLGATKDSLARAMRGGSRSQSNSAAVTAAINAVDERLGHTDTENKQNREIVQCLFRAAECYNKANISAKQAENFAKDAKRHADEAREEVVKISELLRHAGFDDETVRRLDNMIRTVAEVGLE
ncbi:hypothetical protein PTMSG1_10227 [Pyrenophora teres f. maculata]|nr:hypothetical protein PTMSG1_10227 [Pyrenophora teres f. maculata]